jgi:hypothetical protein
VNAKDAANYKISIGYWPFTVFWEDLLKIFNLISFLAIGSAKDSR